MSDLIKTLGQTMGIGTSPIVPQQPPMESPPGTIVEFPEQTSPGWHPPMSLPDTGSAVPSSADASPGGFGGILQGIGKVASNPLLLGALHGYANALAMPRGMGPITRIAGGLSTGLEDAFVTAPYRQAVTDRMKAQSAAEQAKAQATAKKTQRKEEARGQLSPEEQRAIDLGQSYESIQKGSKEERKNAANNARLADTWEDAARQAKTPEQQQMYGTMAQSLRSAGSSKIDMEALQAASKAVNENNKEAFHEASVKFNQGMAQGHLAVAQGELGVSRGGLSLRQAEFGERKREYEEEAPKRAAELEHIGMQTRATQAGIPKTQAESDLAQEEWEKLHQLPQEQQQKFWDVKMGLAAKPTAAGKEKTENIEFPDPATGMNVSMTAPTSQIMGMQRPSKYSEKEKAGISIVKSAHGLSDMLRDALGNDPDKRSWATRQIQYLAYKAGVPTVAMGDKRKEIISLAAGTYQKLASEAATTAGLRNFGFIDRITPHFPNPAQSDEFNRAKLDILDKILDQDAESLRTPGIIKDPEIKRRVEEQLYGQFGDFYKAIGKAGGQAPAGSPAPQSNEDFLKAAEQAQGH